jgi:hypothetical protein
LALQAQPQTNPTKQELTYTLTALTLEERDFREAVPRHLRSQTSSYNLGYEAEWHCHAEFAKTSCPIEEAKIYLKHNKDESFAQRPPFRLRALLEARRVTTENTSIIPSFDIEARSFHGLQAH